MPLPHLRTVPAFVLVLAGIVSSLGGLALTPFDATASAISQAAGDPRLLRLDADSPTAYFGMGSYGVSMRYTAPSPFAASVEYLTHAFESVYSINEAQSSNAVGPVAAASNDHTLVVFANNVGTTDYFIWAYLYDAQGTLLDLQIIEQQNNTLAEYLSLAVEASTGNFMLVWREKSYPSNVVQGVFGRKINVVANAIGLPVAKVKFWNSQCSRTDIAYATEDITPSVTVERFVVTWRFSNSPTGLGVVYAQHADASTGIPTTRAAVVLPGAHAVAHTGGSIASKGDGLLIVYEKDGIIYGQKVTATLALDGAEFEIENGGRLPDVAASGDEYLVVYTEPLAVPAFQRRIMGEYVSFDGLQAFSEFEISGDIGATLGDPSVASNGASYLVAYTRLGTQFDVYVQRVGRSPFTFLDNDVDNLSEDSRGVAWGDWASVPLQGNLPDLYIANAGNSDNGAYLNDDGVLNAAVIGANDARNGQGVSLADIDNDGDLDMFVSNAGQADELYRNTGGTPVFTPIGSFAGVGYSADGRSVDWGDYDGDGLIDLVVANRLAPNRLYRNNGGTVFIDESVKLGTASLNSEGICFVDFDGDGDQDIYVGNAGATNELWVNDGSGNFTESAAVWGLADGGSARSVSWADFDQDGRLELYISKYNQANSLYDFDGISGNYVDVAAAFGVADVGRGESACWADVDLDGDLDLFLANYLGQDRLFLQLGNFVDIGDEVGLDDPGRSLGAAWGDLDADGDPDLCIGEFGGQNGVFENGLGDGNNYISVHLEGTTSNAAAIGAVVTIVTPGWSQMQVVGGGNGYLSQNDLTLIFGLGTLTQADELIIDWPDGSQETFIDVWTGQFMSVIQGGPTAVAPPQRTVMELGPNFPNPFNPRTTIPFFLPEAQRIRLTIFDLRGRRVRVLAVGEYPRGRHELVWDGLDGSGSFVASGVYFYSLQGERMSTRRRMALVR